MAANNIVKFFFKVLVVYHIASVVWSLSTQDVNLGVKNFLHGSGSFLKSDEKEVVYAHQIASTLKDQTVGVVNFSS